MNTLQETSKMGAWPRNARALCLTAALGLMGVMPAWAQNAIKSISSVQQAGAEMVRIELAEPLAALPNGFTVQTPPRIAIDLPGVVNAIGRSAVEINQGNLRSANIAQAGDRTRIVLNLRQASGFRAQLQGNALLLMLDAAPAPATTEAPVHFAQSQNANALALRDIDFRRGNDGAGRVVVSLPSDQVGVDIQQQGQSLVVEFLRSSLPEQLRRRLDVSDFGTPVQMISTTQVGDRVRMVVEPKGNWEHSAYQSDNQFVLEVRPQKLDPNKLVSGPGYAGDKLSLNFQNIDVRALLQVIADFTNFNVVTSDTVTGSVTLRLKDVPWDQALDIIMQAKGLGLKKAGNVLWIAPKDELAAKEKLELESKAAISQLEPLRTQSFQLNYTRAEVVANGLTGQNSGSGGSGGSSSGNSGASNTRILSPRGSVIFESRTNQLFVSDIPSKLEEISAMIAKIDIPVRQVQIEARIVEASDTFGRSLGVKLGGNDLRGQQGGIPGYKLGGSNYITFGGNYSAVGAQTNQGVATSYGNTQFINLPANVAADAFGGAGAANIALSLFSATANRFLNLELSALEADGKGKIVSSPRVVTADQTKALIEQGEEIPYQQATSSGATSISFKKAVLKLEVTPQITPEGNVIMTVDVNKDSRGTLTPQGYAINNKHVQTQVLVENGGTVVIGGIYTQDQQESIDKVPLLGDVPILGNLFKSTSRTAVKTELLIFLTPKVVSDKAAVR